MSDKILWGLFLVTYLAPACAGNGVLTHEAVIDAAWKDSIEPLLLTRFPNATSEELLQAHAYVYGGAIIQDMGDYPFGSKFFSDLTHYVRSGDFVIALIGESQDLNEYAFALGALAHYAADTSGHPLATNRAVALMYPKLAKKYGSIVTYEDKPSAHSQVEFAFDVDQVAEGNYAPKAYHDLIGFEVLSLSWRERSQKRTRSKCPVSSEALIWRLGAIATAWRQLFHELPRAWHLKQKQIQNSHPNETRKKYIYNLSRSGYRKDWGDVYEKPDFFARLKAFFLRLVPKVGPFSVLAFHPPTPAVEQMYMHSFNETLIDYRRLLLAQQEGRLQLPNDNFDTGEMTEPGTYRLMDKSHAELLDKVNDKPVSEALRENILDFYADLGSHL